jgi:hypothetical protein
LVAAWLRAPEGIIERIESELARSSWELADPDPFSGVALPPETPPAAQPTGPSVPLAQPNLNYWQQPDASCPGSDSNYTD